MPVAPSPPRSLVANAVWTLVLNVWAAALGLFLTPLLIARLGVERYGVFAFVLAVCTVLTILDLGITDVAIRFAAYHNRRGDAQGVARVLSTTFAFNLIASAVGWAALFLGAPCAARLLDQPAADTVRLLRVAAFSVAFQFAGSTFGAVPVALERYDVRARVAAFQTLVQTGAVAALVVAGFGLYHVMVCIACVWLLTDLVHVAVAGRLLPGIRVRPRLTADGLREIWRYELSSAAGHVLRTLSRQADRLLLARLVGAAAVAFFAVPFQLLSRGLEFVRGSGSALFPRFSSLADPTERSRLYGAATWTLLAAASVLFVPATVLLPDFLRLWISADFAASSGFIAQVIAAGCLVRSCLPPTDALLRGMGEPRLATRLAGLVALTGLGGNVVLIPIAGLRGAAYAFFAASLWGVPAAAYVWRRVLRAGASRPLARHVFCPLACGFVALCACQAIRSAVDPAFGWGVFFGLGALFAVLTGAVVAAPERLVGGAESHVRLLGRRTRELIGR